MSKAIVKLSLKDLYAIKHSLHKTITDKENVLLLNVIQSVCNLSSERKEIVEKDVVHEKALLLRIEAEIADYKEENHIKGD